MDVPAVFALGGLEPLRDVVVFVGCVVVDDEVHVELGGDVALDEPQEPEELQRWWRCRGRQSARTSPVAAFSAANNVVVPWRR